MRKLFSLTVPLLAMLAVLAAGSWACASSKKKADPVAELRSAIARQVPERDRADRLSASVDELERTSREIGTLVERQRAALAPMLHDYRTSRADFEAKLAELNGERAVLTERLLVAHLAFKSAATSREWKKLRKLEQRVLSEAAANSLGQTPFVAKEG